MWNAPVAPTPVIECPNPPTETVSAVAWSPPELAQQKNFLAASSWDKTVRVWELPQQAVPGQPFQPAPASQQTSTMPVLDTCISPEGNLFFAGCCQTAKMVSLAQAGAQAQQVASHDLPINCCKYSRQMRILVTGGWDGQVKMWDCKSPTPGKVIDCGAPVVDLDVVDNVLTIATARQIIVYDLGQMREMKRSPPHAIKEQLRCIANIPNKTGYVTASIESRACVMYFQQRTGQEDFSFRCHKEAGVAGQPDNLFSVNAVSFHPTGTFATAGSNGVVSIWNAQDRKKISNIISSKDPQGRNTISAGKFDSYGSMYGYASSYDWTKGQSGYNPALPHKICIRPITEKDVREPTAP
eukprot:Rhum_TRINITY_DN12716_c0_g1::Rhum_TRINITY_DN12716_c0_g1_i2::g.53964::m.53964/K14298/RAE1, GLE2; mRNA export factor